MQLEPALLDSASDARAELCAGCLEHVHEGVVDLFDMDSAVLYRLDARSQLNELPGGGFRAGKSTFGDEFHCGNQKLKPMLDDVARPGMSSKFGTYAQILPSPYAAAVSRRSSSRL